MPCLRWKAYTHGATIDAPNHPNLANINTAAVRCRQRYLASHPEIQLVGNH